jgi:mRNA interferase YafQ
MKTLQVTKQFKKDMNRIKKQRKDTDKLKMVIDALCDGKGLDPKYKDHKLIGNYDKARECHIEPDWLLIYELFEEVVKLRRTGSHAELFKL